MGRCRRSVFLARIMHRTPPARGVRSRCLYRPVSDTPVGGQATGYEPLCFSG